MGDQEPVRLSKNKVSKGQQRRVNANHQRRLKTSTEKPDYDDNLFGETAEGIVISRFGVHADVESADGEFTVQHPPYNSLAGYWRSRSLAPG